MKKSIFVSTITALGLSVVISSGAMAGAKHDYRHDHHYRQPAVDYARVVDARPIYQRVAIEVPQESCSYETVSYREPGRSDSYTGTIVGGLIGAAVGHELGHSRRNKDVGAVAGGLLGASIGRDVSRNRSGTTRYREEQVCHTSYRKEYTEQLLGYDVTYKYHGQLYQTRTDSHPGRQIPVNVQVRPMRGY